MASVDHRMEECDKNDIYVLTKSFNYSGTGTSNEASDRYESYALDLYVIKNNDNTSKTEVLYPHLRRPPHDCNLSTCVVIGSTLYIVGGYVNDGTGQYNKTRAVYYIDIRHPENGWKEAAPMNNERIRPSVFGVDGKLYVIGGCNYNRESYIEIYDPVCNKWENFPRLKDGHDIPHCVSMQLVISGESDDNNKKVLLRNTESTGLYLYDVASGSCQAINENGWNGKSSAILDGVLYCVGGREENKIIAHDLEHLDSDPKSVINMWGYTGFDYDCDDWFKCCNSRMVSMGNGMLAVVCPVHDDRKYRKQGRGSKIGRFNFEMVKGRRSNGELYVKATLLSSSTHFVDESFNKCLTVFAVPLPLADESEKYMLVNGGLKKRTSTTCSPATMESSASIYQLQEFLTKTMEENEKKIEQRILQRMNSRLESMESRIISRVQGTPSPGKTEISSSIKAQKNTHQPIQQSTSLFMDSGTTTNISDHNTRHSRRDLQKNTKMTSLNHETEFIDEKYNKTLDIYVCLAGGPRWYIIKNNDGTLQCPTPFPHLSQQPHDFTDSAHVVIGSTIYMVGGKCCLRHLDEYMSGPTFLKTREVYYMDTCSPQPEWKEASPMKYERDNPYVFVVDGKIYLAGGIKGGDKGFYNNYEGRDYNPELYFEVYDPICDKWDNVPPMKYGHRLPTNIMGHTDISGDGDKEKKVLLIGNSYACDSQYYLYDIDSGSCKVIELNNDRFQRRRFSWFGSVVVDRILYILQEPSSSSLGKKSLFAYDPDDLERAPKRVTGLEKYLPSDEFIHMVSLGTGKLAAVWTIEDNTNKHSHSNKVILSCSKFQIVKGINGNGELAFEAHLLSCSTHHIQGYSLEKCLTVKTPYTFVNEIGGLVSDQDTDTDTKKTKKPEHSSQLNKSEDHSHTSNDNEIKMHQLQEMIQKTMAEYGQLIEHRIVQNFEACIESTECRILTEHFPGATTSAKATNLGNN